MSLKVLISILWIFMNFDSNFGQELGCRFYFNGDFGYTCDVAIQNPNGLNNFTKINGIHLPDKSDDDVQFIYHKPKSNTSNIPSILCDTFQFATRIDLQKIGIQTVNEYSFKNCKNVKILWLHSNQITNVDEKSFNENLELESLSLWGNQLTILPEKVFANQHKLLKLSLFETNLTDLPKNVFGSLRNLTWLALRYNKIKVIHSNSFGISPNLAEIDLKNNQIDAIDERFIDNTGVQLLDMSENLCANASIFDNSTSRQQMRNALQTCFNNYKILYPGI